MSLPAKSSSICSHPLQQWPLKAAPLTLTKLRHFRLQGMEYLHQKRIVHFDLKSANLLLGYRDRRAVCKVADFGLSKQKRDTYVSNVTSQRGTLPWIAPEIIKTPHAVTEKVSLASSSNPMLCRRGL